MPVPSPDADGYQADGYHSDGYQAVGLGGGYSSPVGTGGYPVGTGSYQAAGSGASPAPAIGAASGSQAVGSGGYPGQVSGGPAGYPADARTSTYSVPAAAVSGYPAGPAGGYPDPASGRYPAQAAEHGGYPAAGSGGYLAQSTQPVSGGYPADTGPSAYPGPASGYTAGVSGTYSASRPAQVPAEPPLSYPGYSAGGLAGDGSSPYPQNLAGSHPAAPGQGSEQAGGYPAFPAGQPGQFAAASAGVYSPALPQLPVAPGNAGLGVGYPAGQGYPIGTDDYSGGQFRSVPYEPAGYPAALPETGGYAGTDPYALDPYGYPGYRNGGF
jgi:hypothetical protein